MADSTGQSNVLTVTRVNQTQGPMDVQRLQELYRQARGIRQRFEPEWYLNLAFFLGQQWLRWNHGRLDMPTLAPWRRLPVDNRILPVVTSRAARKTKNRPTFVVLPYTADEDDMEAAQIGEKVLEADWVGLDLQQKLYQAILYADICCAGFWKLYWDPTKGQSSEFLYDPEADDYATQGNGLPVRADTFEEVPGNLQTRPLAQGDICVDVLSPFELYPDPLATSLEDAEWIIEEKVRSVEYVKKRYGIEPIKDAPAPVGPVESRLFASLTSAGGDAEEYKGVRVYECWMRPCTDYPEGARFVWANDRMLAEEHGTFDPMPYVMFSGVKTPHRFWPTSIVSQLRGPQVDLNKIVAMLQENAARIGNPSLLKSRQGNVRYDGMPGNEVLWDASFPDSKPEFLQPPEVPVYVQNEIGRITESIMEIVGQREVSNATVPAGVTAASAINLLQEADDTRIGPEMQDMEVALGKAGTKVLRNRAEYNTDERLIRIAGEDGNWDIFAFKGQVLGDEPSVEVQAGSAMPRSKAAKQAAMLEVLQLAFQYGLEFDPRDLRRFFKDYEVAALERLFETLGGDEQAIQRENRQLAQGVVVDINEWDEDEAHVAGHNEFRKTGRFQRLDPMVQEMLNIHVRAHQERQTQQVNTQLEVQSQEPGGGLPPEEVEQPPPEEEEAEYPVSQ